MTIGEVKQTDINILFIHVTYLRDQCNGHSTYTVHCMSHYALEPDRIGIV